jgi:hypothetical protein
MTKIEMCKIEIRKSLIKIKFRKSKLVKNQRHKIKNKMIFFKMNKNKKDFLINY